MNFLFLVQFASQLPPLFFFFSLKGKHGLCSDNEWTKMQFMGMIFKLTRLLYLLAFWEAFHDSCFWIHVVCSQLETLSTSHLPRSLESWEMKLKPSVVSYHAMICKVGEYEANYMILVHKSLFSYTVNCSTECIKSN